MRPPVRTRLGAAGAPSRGRPSASTKLRSNSACAEVSRNAGTGSLFPFSVSGSTHSAIHRPRASARVSAPDQDLPRSRGLFQACRDVDRVARREPLRADPAPTVPVVTPIRPVIRARRRRLASRPLRDRRVGRRPRAARARRTPPSPRHR